MNLPLLISVLLALAVGTITPVSSESRCGLEAWELLPPGAAVPSRVRSPTLAELRLAAGTQAAPFADVLDWRLLNGTVFTTRVGYQLLPSACGSCWAFAAAGALSDRVKIATGGHLPDFNLAPQGLLDCGAPRAGSCNGGSHSLAYEFIATTGLTDETCMPYHGIDNSNWGESDCADRMCRRCDRFGTCRFIPRNATTRVFAAEHGVVRGVEAMQAEIESRGPIACLMYAHADGFENYSGGVITDDTRYDGITHVVVVTGWGVQKGLKYWIVRNSYGTAWGELGYYRQEIGKDIYNMESHDCAWATPDRRSIRALLLRSGMVEQDGMTMIL